MKGIRFLSKIKPPAQAWLIGPWSTVSAPESQFWSKIDEFFFHFALWRKSF